MGQRAIPSRISRHSYHPGEQTVKSKKLDYRVHSTAEEMACSQTPPSRVTCSEQKTEILGRGQDFSITIHQEKLSNADKHKRIQWKGTGILDAKALRAYTHNTWSQWHSATTAFHVTVSKEKGGWKVHAN